MKALEQVPNALQAEAAKAVKQYSAQIREAFTHVDVTGILFMNHDTSILMN